MLQNGEYIKSTIRRVWGSGINKYFIHIIEKYNLLVIQLS